MGSGMDRLSPRHAQVLTAVVEDYIRGGEPVGSRSLSRSSRFALSPATLRNVMADLEEGGLLRQPHTSAGRIPTDQGFRYYVNQLNAEIGLADPLKQQILARLSLVPGRLEEVLHDGTLALSQLTPYVGIVSLPNLRQMVVRHIRFVKLRKCRILAVIISLTGAVRNVLFSSTEEFSQDQLNRFSNYLNSLLGNLTLAGVKRMLLQDMAGDKRSYDELFVQVLALSQSFFAQDPEEEGDLLLDGKLNLLDHPEFADIERMKKIFRAFEEKGKILRVLDSALAGAALQISIGAENECEEMNCCSLVTAGYGRDGRILGRVGVIGPTRMDYPAIIPLVNFIADAMSRRLQE